MTHADEPADSSRQDPPADAQGGWKLYLPGPVDGGGRLMLRGGRGEVTTVAVKGRHTRVLLGMNHALLADAQVPELDGADRGFRTVEEIAADYYEPHELAAAPSAEAVAHYVSQINTLVRKATPPGGEAIELFESVRKVGVRLRRELTVVRPPPRRPPGTICKPS